MNYASPKQISIVDLAQRYAKRKNNIRDLMQLKQDWLRRCTSSVTQEKADFCHERIRLIDQRIAYLENHKL